MKIFTRTVAMIALLAFAIGNNNAQELSGPSDLPTAESSLETSTSEAELVPAPARSILEAASSFQSGWGSLRSDGSLHGKILTPGGMQAGASVSIESGGASIANAIADDQGQFVLSGLQPGMYTLRAESGSGYAVYSIVLLEGGDDSATMEVYCAGLPRSEVERVLAEMWAPGNWFEDAPSSNARVLAPPAPGSQSVQVNMRNGIVNGQLLFPSQNWLPEAHMVKIFRNGQLLATAPADEYGRFSFEPGRAGPVDIVAGGGAYGAMSIEVVQAAGDISTVEGEAKTRFVSQVVATDVALVPLVGEGVMTEEAVVVDEASAQECCAPMGGYMGGGGGFGGGGGGFGYGGFGGLLGAAGLAAAIAALANNDDDGFNFNVPTPIAP